MTRMHSLDRAALALGLASIASLVFVIEDLGDFRFMKLSGASIGIAAVLGALAIAAALLRSRILAVIAGLGFAAAAVIQVVAATSGERWLGANLSTMALWLGLAIGLVLAGAAARYDASPSGTGEGN